MPAALKITLRRALVLAFGLLMLFGLIGEVVDHISVKRLIGETRELTASTRRLQDRAGEMKYIVANIQRLSATSALSGDQDVLLAIPGQSERFQQVIDEMCGLIQDDPLRQRLINLKQSQEEFSDAVSALAEQAAANRMQGKKEMVQINALSRRFINTIVEITAEVSQQHDRQTEEISRFSESYFSRKHLLLLALPLVFAAIFLLLDRSFSKPFRKLCDFLADQTDEDNDFSMRAPMEGGQEIRELTQGVNRMLKSLERTTVSRDSLQEEVEERRCMEEELQLVKKNLEEKVSERTRKIEEASRALQAEIEQRQKMETKLRRSEQKLLENNQYLHSIMDTHPICLTLVKKDGTVLDMNPAGLHLFQVQGRSKIIGQSIYPLIDDSDRQAYELFNQRVCTGEPEEITFTIISQAGEKRQLECMAVPLALGQNKETVQLGISRDLTDSLRTENEKERLQEQLRQVQKLEAIGTLAGGIAHDFNNILTGIFGYAELAKMDAPQNANFQEDINEIIKAAKRAKELIEQILTFSRSSEQRMTPQKIQVILKEATKLLRASLPANIKISQEIDTSCNPALADPTQVHQVIMNLCTNAYHAMKKKGGMLTVSLTPVEVGEEQIKAAGVANPPGPYARLRITDTGVGIASRSIERIFEPYFTTKEKSEGTGLGLSMVHGIVQAHGGHIEVESEVGKGSSFSAFFPCIDDMEVDDIITSGEIPTGQETIIVVDDEEVITTMERRILESLGYHVRTFNSSEKALAHFRKDPGKVDLVITDMAMPGKTGAQLAQELQGLRPEIPIILCTGFSELIDERKALSLGIRKFIMKPILRDTLATAIRDVLDEK